jgi:glycosyltransferase involved in cell wall biosynthesis
MKTEIKLLQNFEQEVGKCYDRVMFVAKSEGEKFDQLLGEKKALIAPLGVDYDFFSQDLHLKKKEKSIVFMGALNVAHNENGIIHFIEHCLPKVLKSVPDAKLYIVGGGATEKLKQYESEHVVFTGRVPDVRVAIGECEVFICPLQFGSGIKTKNLEAMAMGMPVVTTPIGAENIDAQNKKEWIVAENDDSFAESVTKLLLTEKAVKEKMGLAAQAFVRDNFTWKMAEEAFRGVTE